MKSRSARDFFDPRSEHDFSRERICLRKAHGRERDEIDETVENPSSAIGDFAPKQNIKAQLSWRGERERERAQEKVAQERERIGKASR